MSAAVKTAVMGVSGYTGAELVRLLARHPRLQGARPVLMARAESAGGRIGALHPVLEDASGTGLIPVEPFLWETLTERGVEVLFLATPHESARELVPEAAARGLRVIDLSGAWRLDEAENRAVYGFEDADQARAAAVQREAVYGMPELHRQRIRGARIVANPGCYATAAILALKPLMAAGVVDADAGVICDAKSGVSGAGKAATATTHFMHAAENLSAYGVFTHRHVGELLEQLGMGRESMTFTPHLLPIARGILATSYVRLTKAMTQEKVSAIYENFYAGSPMVRLRGASLPEIQFVARTNYCDVGWRVAADGRRVVIVSCLDNLLKGASGQAVQNLNVMMGWRESEGLE